MVSMRSDTNQQQLKKRTRGKQKVEIKKIEKKESRHVTFTKRRNGLFKKCYELCSMYDSEFAAIAFSIGGKPFISGHPSADRVIQRFVHDSSNANWSSQNASTSSSCVRGGCCNWWDNPINDLGLEDLERFKTALEGLRDEVLAKVDQISRSNAVESTDNQSSNYYQWMEDNVLSDGLLDLGLLPPEVCLRDGIVSRVDQFGSSPEIISHRCIDSSFDDQSLDCYQLGLNIVPQFYQELTGFAF